jgi:carbon-monoxide dehydrogenase catalytic subunit
VYRHVTIGTSANIFHAQQVARTLKAAVEHPESGLKIRDKEKLLKYAEMAGLNSHEDVNKVAVNFANWVLADISRPYWEESAMAKVFAPPKR